MFWSLVQKELKAIILSPKFATTFGTLSLLIILSIYIGINEFQASTDQYNTATQLVENQLQQSRSWRGISNKTYRRPDPMQIFVPGTHFDIGRYSNVDGHSDIKLKGSTYSEDPIFAIFRQLDFTLVVTIVFSLFAILFTYNSISGERENGTLKLVFSNSISRTQFILAKITGTWLGLVLPVFIPILIGILLLVIYNVPMTGVQWLSVASLILFSIIYFTFFIVLGVAISASTKFSSVSFLVLLIIWIASVFIIPRVGVMAAGQLVEVPSIAQLESQKDSYAKERWNQYVEELGDALEERNAKMAGMTELEKEEYEDNMSYQWMIEDDKRRKDSEKDIAEYSAKLNEDFRNRKLELEKLALSLSKLSPTSSYMLAVMNLAYTDIHLKTRYEDSITEYKKTFLDYTTKKAEETGARGGITISLSSEGGFKMNDGRSDGSLDVSGVPRYTPPEYTFADVMNPALGNIAVIILFSLVSLGLSFYLFNRYDLR